MSNKPYPAPDKLRIEAVKPVVDRGHAFRRCCKMVQYHNTQPLRLDKEEHPDKQQHNDLVDAHAKIKWQQRELKRATEERDILKKPL